MTQDHPTRWRVTWALAASVTGMFPSALLPTAASEAPTGRQPRLCLPGPSRPKHPVPASGGGSDRDG